jgi:hypothetical protein
MNKQEVLRQLQEYYDKVMEQYLAASDSTEKEGLFGMLKGYKSSIIIVNLLDEENTHDTH